MRVPGIVHVPGLTKPGTVCDEPIVSVDYYPTILELASVTGDPKHNAAVDGVGLVPVLKDPAAKLARDALFWHYPHYHTCGAVPHSAIRARDWKLIEFHHDRHVELYNLARDIGESTDLAKSNPAKARQLRDRLHAWREAVKAQMPPPNPAFTEAGLR